MFSSLEQILVSYAHTMPLEQFALFASFVEEVIAPIPSPLVMITTGSLASLQGYPLYGLVALAFVAMVGKTAGGLVVYFVADKAEDIIFKSRAARLFAITHEQIEALGARLGNGARDYVILILLRALPIVPSTIISVGSGVLKLPIRLYLTATIIGTLIRDGIYLYFGFVGVRTFHTFLKQTETIESYLQLVAIVAIAGTLGVLWHRRRT